MINLVFATMGGAIGFLSLLVLAARRDLKRLKEVNSQLSEYSAEMTLVCDQLEEKLIAEINTSSQLRKELGETMMVAIDYVKSNHVYYRSN